MSKEVHIERWAPVFGYEGLYEVSDIGRVVRVAGSPRCRNGRYVATRLDTKGYPYVSLWRGNSEEKFRVHTLVLTAFVGEAPEGQECCHRDGVAANCALANLRWGTHSSNLADKKTHGTSYAGNRHHWSKVTDAASRVRALRDEGHTQAYIAELLGLSQATISYHCNKH